MSTGLLTSVVESYGDWLEAKSLGLVHVKVVFLGVVVCLVVVKGEETMIY